MTFFQRFLQVAAGVLLAANFLQAQLPEDRPNIVLIMVDDMGFSDPGFVGGEIQTPNMDKLARGGMIFTNFCNNGKCLPTRQSLFLGNYARNIHSSENTELSYAMKAAGYGSYMAGKVHGHTRFGWDKSVTMFAAASHWAPEKIWVNGLIDEDFLESHPDYYSSDTFTDYALKYLDEHQAARPDDPFFLYLAFSAPHDPLHAPEETVAKYDGVYEVGWDKIRQQRYDKVLESGIFESSVPLAPRDPDVPAWDSLSAEEKAWEAAKMRVHAAMVDRIDQNIGRVLKKLEELDESENTLVVFLSDNGANSLTYGDPDPNFRGGPGTGVALGKNWAWASNTPFKGYKSSNFEGGGHTPAVFYWPKTIKPESHDRDLAHVMDITATCLDLAGLPHDQILGKSLRPAFEDQPREMHDGLGFAFRPAAAWREGPWKLVRMDGPWELYHMTADPTEATNLAADKPELVKELEQKWLQWNKGVSWRGQPEDLAPPGAGGQELTLIELEL